MREENVEIKFKTPEYKEIKTSRGLFLANRGGYKGNGIFEAIKIIEDIELANEIKHYAIECIFRMLRPKGKLRLSRDLWGKLEDQPTLRGKFVRNEYYYEDSDIVFKL